MNRLFAVGGPPSPRLWLVAAVVAAHALVGAACTDDKAPTAAPAESGVAGVALTSLPTPPDADPYDLTARYRSTGTPPPRPATTVPAPQTVGATRSFTITDLQTYTRSTAEATLRLVTPRAYWYVDNRVAVDPGALETSSRQFEERSYPTNLRHFGDTIRGGFDGDPRLTVLLSRFGGAAGYYSSPDEFPRAVHSFSNERLMLYINAGAIPPGGRFFDSVVAHELQHALHHHADPNEESWVNEGLSVLAEELNGFRNSSANTFQGDTNIQLTDWDAGNGDNAGHYAAAHLFLRFLAQHHGGYERLRELVAEPLDGVDGVDAYLARTGSPARFRDVFKHWVVANAGVPGIADRWRYDGVSVRGRVARRFEGSDSVSQSVRQHAARYYEVQPPTGAAEITFAGAETVRLLPADSPTGRPFWWSNRGDLINSTLTRELDLTQSTQPVLTFQTWHNIEKGWDYAYVAVSTDQGRSWTALAGARTSTENPLGNSYGPGYTGASGGGSEAQWVEERVDLAAYAGRRVLLRFEYVTDAAANTEGLALDDVRLDGSPLQADGDGAAGWDPRGFVYTANRVAQEYLVQVVTTAPSGAVTVSDVELGADGRGSLRVCCFGGSVERAVVVVAALAPATTQPAAFKLEVRVSPN